MLNNRDYGYSVMNKELTAYSFEDSNLETCKRYCRKGDVVTKQIPYVAGFSIRIMWYKWHTPISFKYSIKNILWLHFSSNKEYLHKTGEIVYENN